MENAAWRLALGAVRKLHWRTFCEPQKQKGEIKREWKMLLGAWRLALSESSTGGHFVSHRNRTETEQAQNIRDKKGR
jgi:hypothetical protein